MRGVTAKYLGLRTYITADGPARPQQKYYVLQEFDSRHLYSHLRIQNPRVRCLIYIIIPILYCSFYHTWVEIRLNQIEERERTCMSRLVVNTRPSIRSRALSVYPWCDNISDSGSNKEFILWIPEPGWARGLTQICFLATVAGTRCFFLTNP